MGKIRRQLFLEAGYAWINIYAGTCIYWLGAADKRKLQLLAANRTGCERCSLGWHQYRHIPDAVCLCTGRASYQLCQFLLNDGWLCRFFSSMLGSAFVAWAENIRILNIRMDTMQLVFIISAAGVIASALYSRNIKEK